MNYDRIVRRLRQSIFDYPPETEAKADRAIAKARRKIERIDQGIEQVSNDAVTLILSSEKSDTDRIIERLNKIHASLKVDRAAWTKRLESLLAAKTAALIATALLLPSCNLMEGLHQTSRNYRNPIPFSTQWRDARKTDL
jgi:FtsZ-binding cell division protein ZapB